MSDDLDEVVFIDVSKWQGEMNWEVAKPKIHFAYIKALEGTSGVDPQFARNKAELIRLKIPWSAYQYFKPDKDPKKQAYNFAMMVGHIDQQGRYVFDCQLRPAVDVETRPVWITKQAMVNAVTKFVNEFFNITGVYPMIYTSKNFWDNNLPRTDLDNVCWLWVAHYNKYVKEPLVPLDWSNRGWTKWQWSADGNLRGAEFGAQSKSIDVNRVKNGLAGLRLLYPDIIWLPLNPNPEPEPPVMITIPVYTVVWNTGLNVRNQPNLSGTIYFVIPKGTKVEAVEEIKVGNDTWVRVGQKQYCAKFVGGKVYLA